MKNLLFITWDSDQTNYLESLFFPIFSKLQETERIKVFVAQYSWAKNEEVARIKKLAEAKHLTYFHFQVSRFPIPTLGVIIAVLKSSFQLTRLIFYNKIDVLMPRSTMPALMLNRIYGWIKAHNLKVIFDADGFPIQERVDFAGLNTDSFQYRHLQKQEKLMLDHAHVIFTRSKQAIDKHLKTHPNLNPKKFFCVSNGRDECLFQINDQRRREKRAELGFDAQDFVWVYTGSLGKAYAWEQLMELADFFISKGENVKLLILTRNAAFIQDKIPVGLSTRIKVIQTEFSKIPEYLNAGDLGINLRLPAPSLCGLFPVKLGEYLLTGLPVLASVQIGDTASWISERKEVIGVDLTVGDFKEKTYRLWSELGAFDKQELRQWAVSRFGLEAAVSDYLKGLE